MPDIVAYEVALFRLGTDAWVVVQNSDVVVRLTVDASGIPTIGAPLVAGPSNITHVDLQVVPAGLLPGKAPRGISITRNGVRAYVSSFVTRSVTAIDISDRVIRSARVALFAVGPVPERLYEVEQALAGAAPECLDVTALGRLAGRTARIDTACGRAPGYQRHLAAVATAVASASSRRLRKRA